MLLQNDVFFKIKLSNCLLLLSRYASDCVSSHIADRSIVLNFQNAINCIICSYNRFVSSILIFVSDFFLLC